MDDHSSDCFHFREYHNIVCNTPALNDMRIVEAAAPFPAGNGSNSLSIVEDRLEAMGSFDQSLVDFIICNRS